MSATAVVVDQLGRQPDLADLAPPGEQQLAHGLAALDLLAAETLGATRRVQVTSAGHPAPDRCAPGSPGRLRARDAHARAGRAAGDELGARRLARRLGAGRLRSGRLGPGRLARRRLGARGPARRRLGAGRLAGRRLGAVGLPRRLAGRRLASGLIGAPSVRATRPRGPGAPMSRRPCLLVRSLEDSLAHDVTSGRSREHHRGQTQDALAAPERPEALGPAPLHADRRAEHGAQAALHLVARAAPAWAPRRPPSSRRCRSPPLGAHLARPRAQQLDRVGAGRTAGRCRGSAGRVAEPGRAEQGVGDGVGHGVAVAVADEAGQAREHAAAEHQRPGGVVAGAVDVEPCPTRTSTDACTRPAAGRPGVRPLEVGGRGDLAVGGLARHRDHPAAAVARRARRRRCPRHRWRGPSAGRRRGTPAGSARRRASPGPAWSTRRRRRRRP